jgi:hypothetical protein
MRNLRIEAETERNGCLCDGLADKNAEHHYFCSGEHGERGGIVAGARIYRIYNQSFLPLAHSCAEGVTPASPPTCNRLADSAPKLAP